MFYECIARFNNAVKVSHLSSAVRELLRLMSIYTPTQTHLRLLIIAVRDLVVSNVDKTHLPLLLLQLIVEDLKKKKSIFQFAKSYCSP